jgi:aspartate-semialdehyde dehydrogenase
MTSPKEAAQETVRPATRVAIAGASSLLGKELKALLEDSRFPAIEVRLLDEEIAAGILTELAGEPAVIETVNEESFERIRIAFFTGSAGFSIGHGMQARSSGAAVIDLSGGMGADPGAKLWIPGLDSVLGAPVSSITPGEPQSLFLVPSVPADVAISVSAAFAPLGLERLAMTFLQPASERGAAAIEELESQVVNLLSFQPISKKVFDAQIGFNTLSNYGPESAEDLNEARARIVGEVRRYLDGRAPMPAISLAQAPVFHSHTFTAYAEFRTPPVLDVLVKNLEAAGLKVTPAEEEAPTNVNVVGEGRPVLRQPQRDGLNENGVWLWGAADNLRVPAATAVAIAEQLLVS